jgi:hypothetical protein
LRLDRRRFNACIDHLVRALFFDLTGLKWLHSVAVASPNFYDSFTAGRVQAHQRSLQTIEVSRAYLAGEPIRGENPEVFRYRIRHNQEGETLAFAGQFYELFEVFAYSSRGLGAVAA